MTAESRPGLLVSVRSADEAHAALAGGAALIDVKEPAHGPLGRAEDAVIADVVRAVAGRRPVSAALGELTDGGGLPAVSGLSFVKWGLASCAADWLRAWLHLAETSPATVVLVAYADWQCAQAPPVEEVFELACTRPGGVVLVDTHCKDPAPYRCRPATLLDWLPADWVIQACQRCRKAGVRIALAGSLGPDEIAALHPAQPDWFAVRGAACAAGERGGVIEAERVRRLVQLIQSARTAG